jgi:hypothetical protein
MDISEDSLAAAGGHPAARAGAHAGYFHSVGASDLIRGVVTGGLSRGAHLYEVLRPGPARLGAPLPASQRPAPDANPVVLVPGFTNDAGFMAVWQRSLEGDGLRAFSFDDPEHGLGDVRTAATRLAAFVDDVRARTHADHVDVVAYSAGNTVARTWMTLLGGAPHLHTFVNLDGSWQGDDDSRFLHAVGSVPLAGATLLRSMPRAEWDLQRSSPLFAELHQHPEVPDGVRVTSIYPARDDLFDVVPGGHNVPLPDAPGHIGMARSSVSAYDAARAALLEPDHTTLGATP